MNFLRSPSGRGKAYTFLRDLSVMSIPDHIISVSAAIAQFLPLEFSVPDTPICCTLSHPVHLRYPTFVPFVLGVTNTQLTNNVAYGYNIITQLISIDSNKSTFMGLKIPVWAVQFCPPAPLRIIRGYNQFLTVLWPLFLCVIFPFIPLLSHFCGTVLRVCPESSLRRMAA